jgi:hypothetical protein
MPWRIARRAGAPPSTAAIDRRHRPPPASDTSLSREAADAGPLLDCVLDPK